MVGADTGNRQRGGRAHLARWLDVIDDDFDAERRHVADQVAAELEPTAEQQTRPRERPIAAPQAQQPHLLLLLFARLDDSVAISKKKINKVKYFKKKAKF